MAFEYRTELTEQILKSPQAKRILSFLSPVYGDAYVMLWLIQITGALLDRQEELVNDHIVQAFPQTATWSISRWEEQCGVTPDPEWDLSQRRRALIAREKPTTPMGPLRLEEIVSNAAGGRVSITENTGKNAFELIFWEKPESPAMNRRGAFRELNRFKPAHLVYSSEMRMDPVLLENHQAFCLAHLLTYLNRVQEQESMSLARFRLLLREQNREEAALAIVQWCGVAERDRERLTRLLFGGWRGENRKGFAMSGQGYLHRTRTKGQLSLTRLSLQSKSGWKPRSRPGFTGTARVNNWGQELVRLDGRRRLDGSWRLGQHLEKGLGLEGLLLRWRQHGSSQLALGPVCVYLGRARTGSKPTAGLGFPAAARNRESAALPELSCLLWAENRQRARAGPVGLRLSGGRYERTASAGVSLRAQVRAQTGTSQHMTMTFAAANAQSTAAFVTADTMWRMDGTFRFDGTRKWNAGIERMDL